MPLDPSRSNVVDEPLSYETLEHLLRVDDLSNAWTVADDEALRAHRAAGVELFPLIHRTPDRPHGLPLHTLLWREMADNLGVGNVWPEVVAWFHEGQGLDRPQQEAMVSMWKDFWELMPDPLDTDAMIRAGQADVALGWFERSLEKLADLGLPHPGQVLPDAWAQLVRIHPVARMANVAFERNVLQDLLDQSGQPLSLPVADNLGVSPVPEAPVGGLRAGRSRL